MPDFLKASVTEVPSERHPFIDQTANAPGGGEVQEDRLTVGAQSLQAFWRIRLPVAVVGNGSSCPCQCFCLRATPDKRR